MALLRITPFTSVSQMCADLQAPDTEITVAMATTEDLLDALAEKGIPDYEAAADAFNHEMLRITGGVYTSVEMRAIHKALDAALGKEPEE